MQRDLPGRSGRCAAAPGVPARGGRRPRRRAPRGSAAARPPRAPRRRRPAPWRAVAAPGDGTTASCSSASRVGRGSRPDPGHHGVDDGGRDAVAPGEASTSVTKNGLPPVARETPGRVDAASAARPATARRRQRPQPQPLHRRGGERAEDPPQRVRVVDLVVAIGQDEQRGQVVEPAADVAQRVERRVVGPVQRPRRRARSVGPRSQLEAERLVDRLLVRVAGERVGQRARVLLGRVAQRSERPWASAGRRSCRPGPGPGRRRRTNARTTLVLPMPASPSSSTTELRPSPASSTARTRTSSSASLSRRCPSTGPSSHRAQGLSWQFSTRPEPLRCHRSPCPGSSARPDRSRPQ